MMTRGFVVLAAGLMLAASSAQAGDASAGKVKSEGCVKCHGDTGNDGVPIAGMEEAKFIQAMKEYQSGARKNKAMTKAVTGLSEADLADLAAYYATLK